MKPKFYTFVAILKLIYYGLRYSMFVIQLLLTTVVALALFQTFAILGYSEVLKIIVNITLTVIELNQSSWDCLFLFILVNS